MINAEWLGAVAAVLTTASFAPQAIHVIRTRDTRAISLVGYPMFTLGVVLWGIYGFWVGSWSIFLANVVTFGFAGTILALKLRDALFHGRSRADSTP
ncbi:hypothetical protein GC169_03045 [bacterium]|nr:hypothetical protein [bacterium]